MRPRNGEGTAACLGAALVLLAATAGLDLDPAAASAPPLRDPAFFLDLPPLPVLGARAAGHGGGPHVPHAPIRIVGDAGFTLPGGLPNVANGVVGGSGTADDPYRIEGWDIGPFPGGSSGIFLQATTKHVLVRGNLLYDHRMSASDQQPGDTTLSTTTGAGVKVVNARNVRIEANEAGNNVFGIVLYGSSEVLLRDNDVVGGAVGLWLEEMGGQATARGNAIGGAIRAFGVYSRDKVVAYVHDIDTSNTIDGLPILYLVGASNLALTPATHPAAAVAVVNGANVDVSGYALSGNAASIIVAGGGPVRVRNVTLEENEAGLLVVKATGVSLQDSLVRRNIYGARFENAPFARVTHNDFDNNTRACCVADAVLLRYRSDNARVDNNTMGDNQVGVDVLGESFLGGCPLATRVRDNNLVRNWWSGVFEEFEHPLVNCMPEEVRATHDFWGAADGPSSFEGFAVPPGHGDAVTANVLAAPFSPTALPGAHPRP